VSAATSLARRAALALVLLIGFYVGAILVSALLLLIAYWSVFNAGHTFGTLKLAFFCVVGAGIILWSIFPRFDRFLAPGPRLDAVDQPELFGMIRGLADATKEEMPSEVYLIPDVNAWVAQRGGILGIGSRRVMGIGLPLMQILTVSQLRAVLAHEFGHYYGGDTRLGPVIYNLRGAIYRTVSNLARRRSILQVPFAWYGESALKLTHGVSRQQEFAADELAASLVGAKPLSDALRTIHVGAVLYPPYLRSEVSPVLSAGFRPGLASGFAMFLAAPAIRKAAAEVVQEEIASGKADPFDSHPPLRDRVNALAAFGAAETTTGVSPATTLLRNLDALETELLARATGKPELKSWRFVGWESLAQTVYLPAWTKSAAECAGALIGVRPKDFPAISGDLVAFGKRITPPKGWLPSGDEWGDLAARSIGAALAVRLHQQGWSLQTAPGRPVEFRNGSFSVDVFSVLAELKSGQLTAENWLKLCSESSISDLDLGASVSALTSSATSPPGS
jgi:heat shock protein HtpX